MTIKKYWFGELQCTSNAPFFFIRLQSGELVSKNWGKRMREMLQPEIKIPSP